MMRLLLLSSILCCCFACATDTNNTTSNTNNLAEIRDEQLQERLYGIWEAVSFEVNVVSADNKADSSYIFGVEEERWEERLHVKPVRTHYFTDSTYQQLFRGIDGTVYNTTKGLWNVFGDSLVLLEPDATYEYETSFKDGFLHFQALLDWDGDGEVDDHYTAIHRQINQNPKQQ